MVSTLTNDYSACSKRKGGVRVHNLFGVASTARYSQNSTVRGVPTGIVAQVCEAQILAASWLDEMVHCLLSDGRLRV